MPSRSIASRALPAALVAAASLAAPGAHATGLLVAHFGDDPDAIRVGLEIDNEVSDEYTVIDIYAHDKVGLLYLITSTINQLGLYIGVSKISTKVDQVADVFYVRDIFGHKIVSEEKLEEVRTTLSWAIDDWQ